MKRIRITGWRTYDTHLKNGEIAFNRSDGRTRYYEMTKSSRRRFSHAILRMAVRDRRRFGEKLKEQS